MKKTQKLVLTIIVILTMAMCGIFVYALYTSHSYQKGVVATAREDVPLSSNYLHLVDYAVNPNYSFANPMIEVKENAEFYTFDITVNNFPLAKSSQYANAPITYDIIFDISGGSGTYQIARNGAAPENVNTVNGNGLIQFQNVTLQPGKNTDVYSVTIPAEDLGKSILKTKVVPDAVSLETVENKMLAANITLISSQNTAIFSYDCGFTDQGNVNDLAAFNYNFSISTGRAFAELVWDTDYVEIDKANLAFLQENNCDSGNKEVELNGTKKKLVFKMNYDEMNSFDIIFYRTGRRGIDSIDTLNASVSFMATEDTSIWNE